MQGHQRSKASPIIQYHSVVDMEKLSMSGEVLELQTPSVEIIQPTTLSISETSIEITKPKQSVVTERGSDMSRISGAYEIDNADLGVNKLDKGQVLFSMYTIQKHKEKWDTRIKHMKSV
jgi:hypothetical protein